MTITAPMIALAGLGDLPAWMFIVAFSFWPFHISSALGITTTLTLVGYGTAAILCQSVMLSLLLAAAPFVFRSPRLRRWVKMFYLPLGYPIVTLATNLMPRFL